MTRRQLTYFVAGFVTLHNVEEALTFQQFVPGLPSQIPDAALRWLGQVSPRAIFVALVMATGLPWAAALWSARRPSNPFALWLVLLIQAVIGVNALWHLLAATVLQRSYVPGLVTAAVINLPFSIYAFRQVAFQRWFSPSVLLWLLPAALIVHGPVLLALITFATWIV